MESATKRIPQQEEVVPDFRPRVPETTKQTVVVGEIGRGEQEVAENNRTKVFSLAEARRKRDGVALQAKGDKITALDLQNRISGSAFDTQSKEVVVSPEAVSPFTDWTAELRNGVTVKRDIKPTKSTSWWKKLFGRGR